MGPGNVASCDNKVLAFVVFSVLVSFVLSGISGASQIQQLIF